MKKWLRTSILLLLSWELLTLQYYRAFEVIKDKAIKFTLDTKDIYIAPVDYAAGMTNNVIYLSEDDGETAKLIYIIENGHSDTSLRFQVQSIYFFDSLNGIAIGAAGHQSFFCFL